MSHAPANPVHAYVAYLRVPGFEALAASEQARRKERLEDAILDAVSALALADRVVLDADDGLALVLFGDAERALDVAQDLRRDVAALHVGLNYGPLALTSQGADGRV